MSTAVSTSESEEPRLGPRMPDVRREDQRSIEQNLFSLRLPNLVVVKILI
jgi:hypothetical protein